MYVKCECSKINIFSWSESDGSQPGVPPPGPWEELHHNYWQVLHFHVVPLLHHQHLDGSCQWLKKKINRLAINERYCRMNKMQFKFLFMIWYDNKIPLKINYGSSIFNQKILRWIWFHKQKVYHSGLTPSLVNKIWIFNGWQIKWSAHMSS